MIGAMLERKVFLRWDRILFPNFYIVLAGPAGCRKGTAMRDARRLLNSTDAVIAANMTTQAKFIDRFEEGIVNYTDHEGRVKAQSAVTVFSEEFTVFLGYNNADFMQMLSDWYDCPDPWQYETKHNKVYDIPGLWLNIIGATTPDLLRESLPRESFGGGLNSRIIYVFSPSKGPIQIEPWKSFPHRDKMEITLLRDLHLISQMRGEFKTTESYLNCWRQWYPKQDKHPFFRDRRLSGYCDRRPTHMNKLAMIMNASRGGDFKLDAVDFKRALDWLLEMERIMPQTFEGFGQSRSASVMFNLMQMIQFKGTIPYAELASEFRYDVNTKELTNLLLTLEHGGHIKITTEQVGPEKKRKHTVHFLRSLTKGAVE